MTAALYFDLGSLFVYLAVERLNRFDFGEVTWRPVSLGALFKQTGRSSWGLTSQREANDGADLGQMDAVLEAAERVVLHPAHVRERHR
ncbi:MAG: hypothetical protein M3065_09135 [Actinomycetota bacterium]|nr:hypothetical protein [Actinomycetota bacterium]